jgi:hypothetical protein
VLSKVVNRHFDVLILQQLPDFLVSQVEVQSVGAVEVIVSCILMFFFPIELLVYLRQPFVKRVEGED